MKRHGRGRARRRVPGMMKEVLLGAYEGAAMLRPYNGLRGN